MGTFESVQHQHVCFKLKQDKWFQSHGGPITGKSVFILDRFPFSEFNKPLLFITVKNCIVAVEALFYGLTIHEL